MKPRRVSRVLHRTLGALVLSIGGAALFSTFFTGHREGAAAPGSRARASTSSAPGPERGPGPVSAAAVVVRTPEEVRELVRRCAGATPADEPWLRRLALDAEDPLVAGQAVQALGRMHLYRPEPPLLRLLDDPRPRVAGEALRALGQCDDPEAVQHVAPLLADTDPSRRALAIQALGRLPGSAAREALLVYQREGDPGDVERAFLRAALGPEPVRVVRRPEESRIPVDGER